MEISSRNPDASILKKLLPSESDSLGLDELFAEFTINSTPTDTSLEVAGESIPALLPDAAPEPNLGVLKSASNQDVVPTDEGFPYIGSAAYDVNIAETEEVVRTSEKISSESVFRPASKSEQSAGQSLDDSEHLLSQKNKKTGDFSTINLDSSVRSTNEFLNKDVASTEIEFRQSGSPMHRALNKPTVGSEIVDNADAPPVSKLTANNEQARNLPTIIPSERIGAEYVKTPPIQASESTEITRNQAIPVFAGESFSIQKLFGVEQNVSETPFLLKNLTMVGDGAIRPTPTQLAISTHPNVQIRVTEQVISAVSTSVGETVEIRLDPPELGKVRVLMTSIENTTTAQIISEKPEIADLLRRNAALLTKELTKAGFENVSLDFQTSGDQHPSHQESSDENQYEIHEIPNSPTDLTRSSYIAGTDTLDRRI